MNSYEILKSIHKVGIPLNGTVLGRTKLEYENGYPYGYLTIDIKSKFETILPFSNLVNEKEDLNESLIPKVGDEIKIVVKNHVDDKLYLSAKPQDLEEKEIEKYQQFYALVESLRVNKIKVGIVKEVQPFGIFVNLNLPFIGIIDIGHSKFNKGKGLPLDYSLWPKVGESILCIISYYRFSNCQIGLGLK